MHLDTIWFDQSTEVPYTGAMIQARGYDILNLSYSATIELLHKEGYELNVTEGEGEYVAVVVHSWDEVDATFYKEVGYSVIHHESKEELDGFVGVLHCGGVYTCAALFKGEKNITGELAKNFQPETHLPTGNTRVEDEEDEDEEGNEDEDEGEEEENEEVREDEEEDEENDEVATKRARANEDEESEEEAAD